MKHNIFNRKIKQLPYGLFGDDTKKLSEYRTFEDKILNNRVRLRDLKYNLNYE